MIHQIRQEHKNRWRKTKLWLINNDQLLFFLANLSNPNPINTQLVTLTLIFDHIYIYFWFYITSIRHNLQELIHASFCWSSRILNTLMSTSIEWQTIKIVVKIFLLEQFIVTIFYSYFIVFFNSLHIAHIYMLYNLETYIKDHWGNNTWLSINTLRCTSVLFIGKKKLFLEIYLHSSEVSIPWCGNSIIIIVS